eukprot:TRINITY_DN676_c0_g4_i2.p1 TRINITY_DN676_c0_g4~~TRINITY_DN676_c0_g4_i2.p1  ORF type:complete len:211 (+),score=80.67 TRINITY_DN676_c0_g4_i2:1-633(+)
MRRAHHGHRRGRSRFAFANSFLPWSSSRSSSSAAAAPASSSASSSSASSTATAVTTTTTITATTTTMSSLLSSSLLSSSVTAESDHVVFIDTDTDGETTTFRPSSFTFLSDDDCDHCSLTTITNNNRNNNRNNSSGNSRDSSSRGPYHNNNNNSSSNNNPLPCSLLRICSPFKLFSKQCNQDLNRSVTKFLRELTILAAEWTSSRAPSVK